MKFTIVENTSAHGFEIGEEVRPSDKLSDSFGWKEFYQVPMESLDGERSWFVGLDEMEIEKI